MRAEVKDPSYGGYPGFWAGIAKHHFRDIRLLTSNIRGIAKQKSRCIHLPQTRVRGTPWRLDREIGHPPLGVRVQMTSPAYLSRTETDRGPTSCNATSESLAPLVEVLGIRWTLGPRLAGGKLLCSARYR